jgi:hypothetical protein
MPRHLDRTSARRAGARWLATLITAIFALVLVPSAPAAYTEQYWSAGYIVPNMSIYSGWHHDDVARLGGEVRPGVAARPRCPTAGSSRRSADY